MPNNTICCGHWSQVHTPVILLGLWGIVGIYLGMGIVTYILFKQTEKMIGKLDRVIEILDHMSKKQEKTPYLKFS